MTISAIVATAKNNVIGRNNNIPWYLPTDLKYFKKQTLNRHIIMGRNSFESIGKPLPKRTNIVVTRNPFYVATGCIVVHSIEEGLKIAEQNGETETFIIGGGKIYAQSVDLWDKLYLTEVDLEPKGDVYFPEIDFSKWEEVSCEAHEKDERNTANFRFKVFQRR